MGATDAIAVAGGAEIYALALPQVQRIYLTEVHASPEGDAVFPPSTGRVSRGQARGSSEGTR